MLKRFLRFNDHVTDFLIGSPLTKKNSGHKRLVPCELIFSTSTVVTCDLLQDPQWQ